MYSKNFTKGKNPRILQGEVFTDKDIPPFMTMEEWNKKHGLDGKKWLQEFQRLMKINPKRGPLQLSRAAWNTSIYPYSMPIQWGVGSGNIGCGNEIILHVGHLNVQDHYLTERI